MTRSLGRPRTIAPDAVSLVALRLFDEQGFDAVSMDDIAEATGISRRSLFRLFPTKSALVWGGLDEFVERFRTALAGSGDGDPHGALRAASLVASRFPDDQLEVTRRRLRVIHVTPALDLRADPRLTALTEDIHRFLVERDPAGDDLAAVVRAHAFAAVMNAALTWWAEHDEESPVDVLARTYTALGAV
ncbi:TetR family transcriptional regulator [Microbacterium sp. Bi128]|uniref:TetR family transcriptional regulator n=1 Tax=Microbacterium sp. Bi128 TaxID=2821115 RepID=UPI001DD0F274|nr:TetR family transcriptional regulator [Microbacterium sp. Bi128]CAH0205079.1 Putative mycofactocin biosynthesis transcriptional regulator MftR [Microbacterium sp. Bi128]